MKEIVLKVEGMVCGGCEKRVKKALEQIDGIEKVEADYQKKSVKVLLKEEVAIELIQEKIEDLGFEVKD